jgi:RNA polymerase sigma-B factor
LSGSDSSPDGGRALARETDDLDELLSTYRETRSSGVRELLVQRFLPLVRALARRYAGHGESHEDLVQVGSIGLIQAIDRFEPERGSEFVPFAIPTITGEIRHHLRDRTAVIRVPRRLAQLRSDLRAPRARLTLRLARMPTPSELASEVGASVEDVVAATEAESSLVPLPISLATLDSAAAIDGAYESCNDRLLLAAGFRALPERERRILHLRYFAGFTQDEIAHEVGISQVHVSRLIRTSLERLRPVLEGDGSRVTA